MQTQCFTRRYFCYIAAAGSVAIGSIARAQAPQPMRLRATIDAVDGKSLSLTTRSGEKVTVSLAPDATVVVIVPVRLEDIKPGSCVGTAAMPQPDGTLRALEVHVMPESMRGVGEGHRPFDLQPQSTMTNGTVGTVTGSSNRTLTISYAGGEKTVAVAANTPSGDIRAWITGAARARCPYHTVWQPGAGWQGDSYSRIGRQGWTCATYVNAHPRPMAALRPRV